MSSVNAKKIFRFKLSDTTNDALELFTNANRFNERKEIKSAWQDWCNNNEQLIQDESRRLENLGYTGDITKKMWTSVRYYHMKKENKTIDGVVDGTANVTDSIENKDTTNDKKQKRRKYITLDKSILALIDKHIHEHIKFDSFTPAKGYSLFLDTFSDKIETVIKSCTEKGLEKHDVDNKLKKTYKNRYFNIVK